MRVGIIGAGRVGVVTGLALHEHGHHLTLFDVDRSRADRLGAGEMPFFEPGTGEALRAATSSERWTATTEARALIDCDVLLISVPTPAGDDGGYDLWALREVVSTLRQLLTRERVRWRGVFLRSTVLPGSTEEIVANGLAAGGAPPCPVGYLPEFLREGSALEDARRPDRIVVGADDPRLRAVAAELFDGFEAELFATGVRNAELIKTANNALLSVCISFANEIARLTAATPGADASDVFAGIHLDRRFRGGSIAGIVDYLLPGPGFGGSCLGKDLAALAALARARGAEPLLLEAAMRINATQPIWFVEQIDRAIGGLAGRRALVLGLAFKPGTDDSRDSIALPILRELAARSALVRAHDPRAAASIDAARMAARGATLVEERDFDRELEEAEVVVLVTAWPTYLEMLPRLLAERTTPLLFADTRGILRDAERASCVTYLGVGAGAPPGESGDD